MNRIDYSFKTLRERGHKAIVVYITAGDPNAKFTEDLVPYLAKIGVDIIELGIPFSDPMADGPVIQEASERAIAKGIDLSKILKMVRRIRAKTQVPILLMGYYNNILQYGLNWVTESASKAGVDAFLVVDLPPEESVELQRLCRTHGLHQIFLVAPTTGQDRLRKIIRRASGFLYYVSMTGVTGASLPAKTEIIDQVGKIGKETKIPVVIGFGIKSQKDVERIAGSSDGIVVGSALIELIKKAGVSKLTPALKHQIKNFLGPMNRILKTP